MAKEDNTCSTQLKSGDGKFNFSGMKFISAKAKQGLSYVISGIRPHNTAKEDDTCSISGDGKFNISGMKDSSEKMKPIVSFIGPQNPAKEDNTCCTQLISGDGKFNISGMKNFSEKLKLREQGLSYAIVSVIGPQNTGKSTLLNHLFGTKFIELDCADGSTRTTQGIWLAKATGIDPCTLILDVEGSDSMEREGNITFETQSALFALVMSDVLLINLWCHDIGRQEGGCKTLLQKVFQAMMCIFTKRKRTLLFVIRDKTQTPLKKLTEQLTKGVQEIYDSVPKPEAREKNELSNFFDVSVTSLPNYIHEKRAFEEEVASLRQRFIHSTTPGGLAGDQQEKVPASEISASAEEIWEKIKDNKDLNLPAHKTMVATVRCEKIWNEKFDKFVGSKGWREMEDTLKSVPVKHFGKTLTQDINVCLSEYDEEASGFDKVVRREKRQDLLDKLLQHVQPAYQSMLDYLHGGALYGFQTDLTKALDKGEDLHTAGLRCRDTFISVLRKGCKDATIEQAKWDSSRVLDSLQKDIDIRIAKTQADVDAAQAAAEAAEVKKAAASQVAAAKAAAAHAAAEAAEVKKAAASRVAAAEAAAAAAKDSACQANRNAKDSACQAAAANKASAIAKAEAEAQVAAAKKDAAKAKAKADVAAANKAAAAAKDMADKANNMYKIAEDNAAARAATAKARRGDLLRMIAAPLTIGIAAVLRMMGLPDLADSVQTFLGVGVDN